MGSRLFVGHPSSASPSPDPWVWEQSDSDTDWGPLSDCVIVEPSDYDDAAPVLPPLPSPDFQRQLIENWTQQRSKYSYDLPTRPGPRIRQRMASWEMQPLGHHKNAQHLDKFQQLGSLPESSKRSEESSIPQMSQGIFSKAICLSGNTFGQIPTD